MTIKEMPIPQELIQYLDSLTASQLSWISGYCWQKSQLKTIHNATQGTTTSKTTATPITVLSASQTGNAYYLADQVQQRLVKEGYTIKRVIAEDYDNRKLSEEQILIMVVSTQGDGEPPEEAQSLYKFLLSKKAPKLDQLHYAVLALGDTSYPNFCQAGKFFDQQFATLGAQPILARQDCDIDYEEIAQPWIESLVEQLKSQQLAQAQLQESQSIATTAIPSIASLIGKSKSLYDRKHPYTANFIGCQKITASNSNKDTFHIEIDLGHSGISYQPGDTLGVWFNNHPKLVEEVLKLCQFSGEEPIKLTNGNQVTLRQALTEHDELTQNNLKFIQNYAQISENSELLALSQDSTTIQKFIATTPIVSVLRNYPAQLTAQQFHQLLRPITPRMYSIASSQLAVNNEVHLTVGLIHYQHHNHDYYGGASGYLTQLLKEEDPLNIFIESNSLFRLPASNDTPIIMIAAGTGIAPFRAFMQHRSEQNAKGKNWLFFGNQKFIDDFLYQAEWLKYRQNDFLTKVSTAWSRQQANKVYVQQRLIEEAKEIWQWLQEGAHVYVCGSIAMSKEVELALIQIIQTQGAIDNEQAQHYLDTLRSEKRYQRDVY